MQKKWLAVGLVAGITASIVGQIDAQATSTKHTVKKGDTLYGIATTYKVSVPDIMKWNNLSKTVIHVGQTLSIQASKQESTPTQRVQKQVNVKSTLNVRNQASTNGKVIGTLKNKEMVTVISQSGKWAKIEFQTKTGYVHNDYLQTVPAKKPTVSTPPAANATTHTVKKGETLYAIARQYGVTVNELKTWNALKKDDIVVGQKLSIKQPTGTTKPNPPSEKPTTPTTKPTYPKEGVKGIYVSEQSVANQTKFNDLLGLVSRTELNAMVINVKNDAGRITYDSSLAAVDALGTDGKTIQNPKALLDDLEKKNIYTIARIVTFKDSQVAQKKKQWAMKKKNGDLFKMDGDYWLDPYNREYWDYVVSIAKEAATLGFDEIQFDYVRFPSNRNNQVDGVVAFQNPNGIAKEVIIAEFLAYAKKELAMYGVKVSADVFAWSIAVQDDAGMGQKWENISEVVDVNSPMIYPSLFSAGNFGVKDPANEPYAVVKASLERAQQREKIMREANRNVAPMRPWFQEFSSNGVTYDTKKVQAQLQAAKDVGISEYLMWNAQNNYHESAYKK